jgi:hypothetical protein
MKETTWAFTLRKSPASLGGAETSEKISWCEVQDRAIY